MRGVKRVDALVYADALDCAAKLLAWKAAERRVSTTDVDQFVRAAANCIILADQLRETK